MMNGDLSDCERLKWRTYKYVYKRRGSVTSVRRILVLKKKNLETSLEDNGLKEKSLYRRSFDGFTKYNLYSSL